MIKDLLDQQLEYSLRGEFNKAWLLVQRLLETRPWCNRSKFNAGWFYLQEGNMNKGMEMMNMGRFENIFGSPHIGTSAPIYDGRELQGDSVLLHLEGGLGDEIIGVRFAQEIARRHGRVIVSCHPSLMSLFSRVSGVFGVVDLKSALNVYHKYWVPSMSSEYVLQYSFETLPRLPYITPDPEYVKKFSNLFDDKEKLKVGIKWSGNPDFEHEQFRLFPPQLLFNAVNFRECKIYSLQKERHVALPHDIIDLGPKLKSWEDTAGVIANLDLVISSCTSVAHLAAAMGVKTWIITPILPYYIWSYPRENDVKTWYYETARLFRQEVFQDWSHPFKNIREALAVYVKHNI